MSFKSGKVLPHLHNTTGSAVYHFVIIAWQLFLHLFSLEKLLGATLMCSALQIVASLSKNNAKFTHQFYYPYFLA